MFSCLQILEAFLWFVLIPLLNFTLIILTLSVSTLLTLLLRLVAFLPIINPPCLACINRCTTASSSSERFSLFVFRAVRSIMAICMLMALSVILSFSQGPSPPSRARPTPVKRSPLQDGHLGRSLSHTGALPRGAGRERRPDLPGRPVCEREQHSNETGFAGPLCARPAPCFSAGAARRHPDRSAPGGARSCPHTGLPFPAVQAPPPPPPPAKSARRSALPRGDDLAPS